jgi:hypothetical protein
MQLVAHTLLLLHMVQLVALLEGTEPRQRGHSEKRI